MWVIIIIAVVLAIYFYNKNKGESEDHNLSVCEKYKKNRPADYEKVLSLHWGDMESLSDSDLLQRIHSLNNEAGRYNCEIDQLKSHYLSYLKSKLNTWNALHNEIWSEEKEMAWLDFEYVYETMRNRVMSSLKQENSYYTLCKQWAHEFYQTDYKSVVTSSFRPIENQAKSIYEDFLNSCITGRGNNELGLFLPEIELRQLDMTYSEVTLASGGSLNPFEIMKEDIKSLMGKREVLLRVTKPSFIENIIVRMEAVNELKKSSTFESNQELKDAIQSGNELLASTLKCINSSISSLNLHIKLKDKKE